jgi:hypothetical protein
MTLRQFRRVIGASGAMAVVAAFALGQPAVVAASPASAGRGPGANNVNVSQKVGNQSETTVSVNPTNTKNIVLVSNLEGNGLFEGYSFDGGVTWTAKTIAKSSGDPLGIACCDPSLRFDQFGNLFLAYLYSSLPDKVPVGLSTDGGMTWSHLASVSVPVRGGPSRAPLRGRGVRAGIADQPTITTGAGSVWVTYTSGPGSSVAAGAPVTGLGTVGSFIAREAVPGANGMGDFGDIAIGPGGQVAITYERPQGGQGPANLYISRDPDGLGPMGMTSPSVVTSTNVGGFDFIPAQPNRSVDAEAGLAYDRSGGLHNGRLYFMYTEETPDESNNMDILLRYSDDDGKTWTGPVQINDDTGTNSQFNPKMAIDQTTGNLAFSWYDSRQDKGSGGAGDTDGRRNDDAQYWGAFSTDGGLSFSRNVMVSGGTSNSNDANNGIDFGDYSGLDFNKGVAWPVWSDNSNSTGDNPDGALHQLDIYTAKFKVTH